jgi:hypothetical protein
LEHYISFDTLPHVECQQNSLRTINTDGELLCSYKRYEYSERWTTESNCEMRLTLSFPVLSYFWTLHFALVFSFLFCVFVFHFALEDSLHSLPLLIIPLLILTTFCSTNIVIPYAILINNIPVQCNS